MTGYKKAVEDLKSRPTGKDDITLKPVLNALNELNNPESNYKVILVGGTNGKGSTVEMISELLQAQKKDVGVSKSPHLTSVRERIKINGEYISKKDFLNYYHRINSLDQDLGFFEFITVMAYMHFSKKKVDYAVMEVGLGGRDDATNAAQAELSVITNIGKEHTEFLGETREEIAEEKAGIIPKDGKLVTSEEVDPIKQKSSNRDAELLSPVQLKEKSGKYIYKEQSFQLPVRGSFQKENLENALKAVEELESLPKNLENALSDIECPGRMEVISKNPEIILDGAHNPAALRKVLPDLPEEFTCVFNATETKNIEKMISILEQKASSFILTQSNVEWSEDPEKINEYTKKPSEVVRDPQKAIKTALNKGEPVVVTGSLYLIGNLKKSKHDKKIMNEVSK